MRRAAVLMGALLCLSHDALARFYDTYRADFIRTAFCNSQGAACIADNDPENSFFQNPAALMAGEEGLVYDGDYDFTGSNTTLEPGQSNRQDTTEKTFLAGIGSAGRKWGAALAAYGRLTSTSVSTTILDANDQPTPPFKVSLSAIDLTARLPFAWRATPNLSLGVALNFLYHHEKLVIGKSPASSVSNIDKFPYPAIVLGAIYHIDDTWRVGANFQSPTIYYVNQFISVDANGQNIDFSEDMGLMQPWLGGIGLGLTPWQDDREFFFDLDVIGTTTNGFERTVDVIGPAFSDTGLRAKGRNVAFEPHVGLTWPWWSGSKGHTRAGAYYENGRWDGISGRVHGTAGISYDVGFMELIASVDVARDYLSVGLSFR